MVKSSKKKKTKTDPNSKHTISQIYIAMYVQCVCVLVVFFVHIYIFFAHMHFNGYFFHKICGHRSMAFCKQMLLIEEKKRCIRRVRLKIRHQTGLCCQVVFRTHTHTCTKYIFGQNDRIVREEAGMSYFSMHSMFFSHCICWPVHVCVC